MKNIIFLILWIFSACKDDAYIRSHYATKLEYRCRSELASKNYHNDSLFFLNEFERIVQNQQGPYNAPAYNKQAVVYIDTMVFDTNHSYAAILVMTKCAPDEYNPTFTYDGMVHYSERVRDTVTHESHWVIFEEHGAHHINGESYKQISEILRDNNFVYRSYAAHENNEIGFNIDDCRFWSSDEFLKTIKMGGILNSRD